MQQAALDTAGLRTTYEAWDVRPEDLPAAIERLRSASVLGANITVPHKVAVLGMVDERDRLCELVGATNTIVSRDGRLLATNTDVDGISRTLSAAAVPLAGGRVVVLGAGGAARAAVVAMQQAGVRDLTVANRSPERARELAQSIGAQSIGAQSLGAQSLGTQSLGTQSLGTQSIAVCALDVGSEALRAALAVADLVIQTTSLGMLHGPDEAASPIPAELLRRGQVAFDLVYRPERTPFLVEAARAGARPIGGVEMLIEQGAASFHRWTGQEPSREAMARAARQALEAG